MLSSYQHETSFSLKNLQWNGEEEKKSALHDDDYVRHFYPKTITVTVWPANTKSKNSYQPFYFHVSLYFMVVIFT